jgi:hypothetical protein
LAQFFSSTDDPDVFMNYIFTTMKDGVKKLTPKQIAAINSYRQELGKTQLTQQDMMVISSQL